jgi:AcrR family transcriptional regulator
MSSLHPTAQRILKAAHDILEEKGFGALSFDAIARASGQYKGSITYYFGDKANLLARLADSVGDGIMEQALTRLQSLPSGPERIREAVATNEAVGRNLSEYRLFFDIIAQAARLEDVRKSIAKLYVEYRAANRSMLVESPQAWGEQVEELGTLSLAILDGLALQYMLDPDGFDPGPCWARWEAVLVEQLEDEAGGRRRS